MREVPSISIEVQTRQQETICINRLVPSHCDIDMCARDAIYALIPERALFREITFRV